MGIQRFSHQTHNYGNMYPKKREWSETSVLMNRSHLWYMTSTKSFWYFYHTWLSHWIDSSMPIAPPATSCPHKAMVDHTQHKCNSIER